MTKVETYTPDEFRFLSQLSGRTCEKTVKELQTSRNAKVLALAVYALGVAVLIVGCAAFIGAGGGLIVASGGAATPIAVGGFFLPAIGCALGLIYMVHQVKCHMLKVKKAKQVLAGARKTQELARNLKDEERFKVEASKEGLKLKNLAIAAKNLAIPKEDLLAMYIIERQFADGFDRKQFPRLKKMSEGIQKLECSLGETHKTRAFEALNKRELQKCRKMKLSIANTLRKLQSNARAREESLFRFHSLRKALT